jgi:hypothetical protein
MISGLVDTWVGPPADVTQSTSRSTTSGWRSASSSATKPPIEIPTKLARSIPSSPIRPRTSSATSAIEYGPGDGSLSPTSR